MSPAQVTDRGGHHDRRVWDHVEDRLLDFLSGLQGTPVVMTDDAIAERLQVRRGTVRRHLRLLEDRGLITRTMARMSRYTSPSARRKIHVHPQGRPAAVEVLVCSCRTGPCRPVTGTIRDKFGSAATGQCAFPGHEYRGAR